MLDSTPFLGIPEYTLLTVVAVVAVVVLEIAWARTGIFRTAQYWITMVIVFAFQVPVDGWLTKLSDPIVIYNERQTSGLRLPWDIPVEDFGFGFAMVTLAILLWRRRLDRTAAAERSRQTVPHGAEDVPGSPEQEEARVRP
ncbi:lycopene cyclase domain-containing protein [uncultured Friedmanniella sp.]|uniref:lycopene cyclase domain-containing protein n=1 Tax=uncultured Friedmanniella sp. TaxID=335381 RepID=UPI0035C94AD6